MLQGLYLLVTILGLFALVGGFLGRFHPAGDSLAVFRKPLAILGLGWFAFGAMLGLVPWWALVLPLPPFLTVLREEWGREKPGKVTLYQKNMSFRMPNTHALAADIRRVAPDFLTLQEVTADNLRIMDALSELLPYWHHSHFESVGGQLVASRWPIIAGSRRSAHGLAAARFETPEGPLWLASIHLHWPWPERQPEQHARILEVLDGFAGPVVLGGDFNMVRWSRVVNVTARKVDAEPAGRAHGTFLLKRILNLPIDQVLVPAGRRGATEVRPECGSDHRGLVARF